MTFPLPAGERAGRGAEVGGEVSIDYTKRGPYRNVPVKLQDREPVILLVASVVLLTLSGLDPHDRLTWLLEAGPVLLALPLLVVTYSRFRLTPLLYRLLFIHAVILMVGGHYTYSLTPIGFWMQRVFGFARNHYDRIGHLAQGFVPAILTREILLRRSPLVRGKWLFFLVTCVCLAVSALYELLEWWRRRSRAERPHKPSWEPRAIPGIPSGICFWRWSARYRHN